MATWSMWLCLLVGCFLMHGVVGVATEGQLRSRRGRYPRLTVFAPDDFLATSLHQSPADNHTPAELHRAHLSRRVFEYFGYSNPQQEAYFDRFPALKGKLDPFEQLFPKLAFLASPAVKSYVSENARNQAVLSNCQEFFGLDVLTLVTRHAYLRHLSDGEGKRNKQKADRRDGFPLLLQYSEEKHNNWLFPSYCKVKEDDFQQFVCQLSPSPVEEDYVSFKKRFVQGGLEAVRKSDLHILRLLLTHGYDPDDDLDRSQRSVLMWACAQGQADAALDIVKLLHEHYLHRNDTNSCLLHRSIDGDSVMHFAATGGSLPVCQFLHAQGCAVDTKNNDDSCPLHWAAGSGALDIVRWLAEDLHIPIDVVNRFGCQPSHFAASAGKLEVCQYLHQRGASLVANNHHGHDPLTKAVAFKQNEVISWLLSEIPEARKSLRQLRPWNEDTHKSKHHEVIDAGELRSLAEIAAIVGNFKALKLLQKYE